MIPQHIYSDTSVSWKTYLTSYFFLTLFFILSIVPLSFGILNISRPLFLVICIYHWALFQPKILGHLALFLIGLIQDIILGAPLGITSLVYIALHHIILSQRKILLHQPFLILWAVFTLPALCISLFLWTAGSALTLSVLPILPVILEFLLTILCYPLIIWILKFTNPPLDMHLNKNKT